MYRNLMLPAALVAAISNLFELRAGVVAIKQVCAAEVPPSHLGLKPALVQALI